MTMLVIGTENRDIVIMDQMGMSIKKSMQLKSVPVMFECSGQYDVEYRIYAACRDGRVYLIRNGMVGE